MRNMETINKSFRETCRVLFGQEIGSINELEEWLYKGVPRGKAERSAVSNDSVYVSDYACFSFIPRNRIATLKDQGTVAGKRVESFSGLKDLCSQLGTIGFFVPDFQEGNNFEISEAVQLINSQNIHRSGDIFYSKNISHSYSILGENLFGGYRLLRCKFSIHCYNCIEVSSCFECESCRNCHRAMFCYNCENVSDSMFCFNAKNKRYAIGNVEVGKEQCERIRKLIIKYIIGQLLTNKALDLDIYNVGCFGKQTK